VIPRGESLATFQAAGSSAFATSRADALVAAKRFRTTRPGANALRTQILLVGGLSLLAAALVATLERVAPRFFGDGGWALTVFAILVTAMALLGIGLEFLVFPDQDRSVADAMLGMVGEGGEATLSWGEDGVRLTSADLDMLVRWDGIDELVDAGSVYCLVVYDIMMVPIGREGLLDSGNDEAFRAYLREHGVKGA